VSGLGRPFGPRDLSRGKREKDLMTYRDLWWGQSFAMDVNLPPGG